MSDMTLVVADIKNGRISAASDSLSYRPGDPSFNRQVYSNARPKLLILRADLMVGVAGDDFWRTCEELVKIRNLPVVEVLERAKQLTGVHPLGIKRELIVGALGPARLWQVKAGVAVDVGDGLGRAWIGDLDAFNRFYSLERSLEGLQLDAPMQSLSNLGGNPVVGGVVVRVDTCDHGFGYRSTPAQLFEPAEKATFRYDGHTLTINASFNVLPLNIRVLTGVDPSRGALAVHFCGGGIGYLYPDDRPWIVETVHAATCEDLISRAAELGQVVSPNSECPAGNPE